jgi:hypothetical protein
MVVAVIPIMAHNNIFLIVLFIILKTLNIPKNRVQRYSVLDISTIPKNDEIAPKWVLRGHLAVENTYL